MEPHPHLHFDNERTQTLRRSSIQRVVVTAVVVCCLMPAQSGFGQSTVRFSDDIRPVLNRHCVACHGGVKRAGGISFLSRAGVLAPAESGSVPIQPGDAAKSEVIRRIMSDDESIRMPPKVHGDPLSEDDVQTLRDWIDQGAEWELHWSLQPPVRHPQPIIQNTDWPLQPLDYFVLARLEAAGLRPSAEADRRSWLRRVSFDLVGLPPSPDEISNFLRDDSTDAYGRVVDRLLKSNHYGERWATEWLDLARYSDTMGYERDPNRTVWPWRDWVVDSLNQDLAYDQFLTMQLAGDLLPDASLTDKLATAFHRNTQTNTECGSDDEEFRTIAVLDRLNTTWEGLMSSSFKCAQCHDHPYDPIRQVDFYRFFSLLNSTQDNDANEDFPLLAVPINNEDYDRADLIDREYTATRTSLHAEATELSEQTKWFPLRAQSATSTGATIMEIREIDGIPEITATGNIPLRPVFTLDFPLPAKELLTKQVTAIRIDALPFDLQKAASVSEQGFVLSRIRVQLLHSNQTIDVPLVAAFDNDPTACYPIEASLHEDLAGWSAYPRLNRPRRAVFVPAEPIMVPEGAQLRLILEQNAQSTGIRPQPIARARYSFSEDAAWLGLVRQQKDRRTKIAGLQQQREEIASVNVPILSEQHSSQRRDSQLFVRGSFLDRGQDVLPGIPEVFGDHSVTNRLELAHWMTRPQHPLTARTAVNRVWLQLFGRGLAEIVEDFGSAGQPPSHPELLDSLSLRFVEDYKWSRKQLLREIVLSATYRQSAAVTPELEQRDSENRLLSRGPRTRLSAEMVRDNALVIAGLLSTDLGGPPVMPQQPDGIWRTVYNGGVWKTSPGEGAWRRSLYTFNRRTSGYPSYLMFDASSREVCTVRRLPSNTPLQALVTLNDPVYLEAAATFARRMLRAKSNLDEQLAYGYELATSQPLPPQTLPLLTALYQKSFAKFAANSAAARKVASTNEEAALTVVANALLNLDATIMK